ncbi:MAG: T9SS type A sorting domain-containing protein [Chlorobi bacterium]|nr:T9SS type A sorting domain-containing protein [Chlorobiota bacterium]
MKRLFTLVLFALIFSNYTFAQLSEGGQPHGFDHQLSMGDVPIENMPAVDVNQLIAEDEINNQYKDIPWRFGENFDVNLNLDNSGIWETLPNNDRIWRLRIKCKGAFSINLTYDNYHLPAGAKYFVYNADLSHVIGAFTDANNQEDGQFATNLVKGDETVLEYYEPFDVAFHGTISINIVTHAYRDAFAYAKGFGSSGACNNNVNCPEGDDWQDEKRSVVMLVSGSSGFCTGALVNNTLEDGTPYVLTANHCYSNPSTWIFWFNWEAPECDNPSSSPPFVSLSGASLKAKSAPSDFALVELFDIPPADYNVFYSGWNNEDEPSTNSICIHHPSGDIKKISFDDDPPTSTGWGGSGTDHWKIGQYEDGTTEPGSSGSPLFDQNHRITGQLHGGTASCSSITYDAFGKVSYSWDGGGTSGTRLKDWLDPNNSGVLVMDGYDPNVPTVDYNAQLMQITSPLEYYDVQEEITPEVVFKNKGNLTLTSLTLNYQIDEETVISEAWSGSLEYNETETFTFASMLLPKGDHTFKSYTSDPNGNDDEYPVNDTLQLDFYVAPDLDAKLADIIAPESSYCDTENFSPEVLVENPGHNTITSLIVGYTIDNGNPVTMEWAGNLEQGESGNIVFDEIAITEGEHVFSAFTSLPNGEEDENPANDMMDKTYNGSGQKIILELMTDEYASETSWKLRDADDNVIRESETLENLTLYTEEFCLPQACYTFTIYDSYGDGICCQYGEGYYTLTNSTTGVELANGGEFENEEATAFCIVLSVNANFTSDLTTACIDDEVQFTNLSLGADSYLWIFEGGNPETSTDENPLISYGTAGSYDVTLIAYDSETSDTLVMENYITVEECTGINQTNFTSDIRIFPNPTNGIVSIQSNYNKNTLTSIKVYDAYGQMLYLEEKVNIGDKQIKTLDFSKLGKGLYFIEIHGEGVSLKEKIILR